MSFSQLTPAVMSWALLDEMLRADLKEADEVEVGEWQSIKDDKMPQGKTIEVQQVAFSLKIPNTVNGLQKSIPANQPFAEAQFQDRVSGEPLNPPPSDALWPWAHHLEDDKPEGQYSHTYPERYWPKKAGPDRVPGRHSRKPIVGIRYSYGDLADVVSQLSKSPQTRQAYLPIWFPEDTGAVHGERVPCSLGYHFLLRREQLHCTYGIRSVDYYRHFPDDVYMTMRLVQWMVQKLWETDRGIFEELQPGNLVMHIGSLHVFEAERKRLHRPRR